MKFKCTTCDEVMTLKEDKHVCESCESVLSINEAETLFNDGKIVGIVSEDEANAMISEDDDDKESNDDDKKDDKDFGDDDGKADSEKEKTDDDDGDDKNEAVKDIVIDYTVDVSEDVAALFEGETLSEAFQSKAKLIFEAAVTSKIKEKLEVIKTQYDESYEAKLVEATDEVNANVDKYLDYVVAEWVKDNELAIDQGIKSEMNEEFLTGLRDLFEDHYVHIPEERYDVVEGLAERVDELTTQLDEEINKNVELSGQVSETRKDTLVSEAADGLADTQKEKFKSLAESVAYTNDKQFNSELKTLKESYFKKGNTTQLNEEDVDIGQASNTDDVQPDDLVSRTVAFLNSDN